MSGIFADSRIDNLLSVSVVVPARCADVRDLLEMLAVGAFPAFALP
jgi:hypothetical protein